MKRLMQVLTLAFTLTTFGFAIAACVRMHANERKRAELAQQYTEWLHDIAELPSVQQRAALDRFDESFYRSSLWQQ